MELSLFSESIFCSHCAYYMYLSLQYCVGGDGQSCLSLTQRSQPVPQSCSPSAIRGRDQRSGHYCSRTHPSQCLRVSTWLSCDQQIYFVLHISSLCMLESCDTHYVLCMHFIHNYNVNLITMQWFGWGVEPTHSRGFRRIGKCGHWYNSILTV